MERYPLLSRLYQSQYYRYLPNVFSEELSLHEQLGSVEEFLNLTLTTFNDLSTLVEKDVDKLILKVEELKSFALPENVKEALKDMVLNGTLENIINKEIFNKKLDTTIFDEFKISTDQQLEETKEKLNINALYYKGKNDGTDESIALNALLLEGRPVKLSGIIGVSNPVIISEHGASLLGDSSGWYNNNPTSTRIVANPDFTGEAIVLYKRGTGSSLRAVGMSNIHIDGRTDSNCHGVVAYKLYDSILFSNITVENIDNTKSCFIFTANGYPAIEVSQTITAINLLGHHRNDSTASGQAPVMLLRGLQECLFSNAKMFAGASAVVGNSADCIVIEDCTALTLLNSSVAFTQGHGFLIKYFNKGANVHIINPTIESVKKHVTVENNSRRLFGNISSVPAVGSVIQQGANSAIVYGATSSGVYIQEMHGNFTTGAITQDGTTIGTITRLADDLLNGVKVDNPRIFGSTSLLPAEVDIQGTERFEMTFPSNSPDSTNPSRYDVTIGSRSKGTIIKQNYPFSITDNGNFTQLEVANNRQSYKMANLGAYNLVKAIPGLRTVYYRATDNAVNIKPASGDKFRTLTVDTAYEFGDARCVEIACFEEGIWEIISVF